MNTPLSNLHKTNKVNTNINLLSNSSKSSFKKRKIISIKIKNFIKLKSLSDAFQIDKQFYHKLVTKIILNSNFSNINIEDCITKSINKQYNIKNESNLMNDLILSFSQFIGALLKEIQIKENKTNSIKTTLRNSNIILSNNTSDRNNSNSKNKSNISIDNKLRNTNFSRFKDSSRNSRYSNYSNAKSNISNSLLLSDYLTNNINFIYVCLYLDNNKSLKNKINFLFLHKADLAVISNNTNNIEDIENKDFIIKNVSLQYKCELPGYSLVSRFFMIHEIKEDKYSSINNNDGYSVSESSFSVSDISISDSYLKVFGNISDWRIKKSIVKIKPHQYELNNISILDSLFSEEIESKNIQNNDYNDQKKNNYMEILDNGDCNNNRIYNHNRIMTYREIDIDNNCNSNFNFILEDCFTDYVKEESVFFNYFDIDSVVNEECSIIFPLEVLSEVCINTCNLELNSNNIGLTESYTNISDTIIKKRRINKITPILSTLFYSQLDKILSVDLGLINHFLIQFIEVTDKRLFDNINSKSYDNKYSIATPQNNTNPFNKAKINANNSYNQTIGCNSHSNTYHVPKYIGIDLISLEILEIDYLIPAILVANKISNMDIIYIINSNVNNYMQNLRPNLLNSTTQLFDNYTTVVPGKMNYSASRYKETIIRKTIDVNQVANRNLYSMNTLVFLAKLQDENKKLTLEIKSAENKFLFGSNRKANINHRNRIRYKENCKDDIDMKEYYKSDVKFNTLGKNELLDNQENKDKEQSSNKELLETNHRYGFLINYFNTSKELLFKVLDISNFSYSSSKSELFFETKREDDFIDSFIIEYLDLSIMNVELLQSNSPFLKYLLSFISNFTIKAEYYLKEINDCFLQQAKILKSQYDLVISNMNLNYSNRRSVSPYRGNNKYIDKIILVTNILETNGSKTVTGIDLTELIMFNNYNNNIEEELLLFKDYPLCSVKMNYEQYENFTNSRKESLSYWKNIMSDKFYNKSNNDNLCRLFNEFSFNNKSFYNIQSSNVLANNDCFNIIYLENTYYTGNTNNNSKYRINSNIKSPSPLNIKNQNPYQSSNNKNVFNNLNNRSPANNRNYSTNSKYSNNSKYSDYSSNTFNTYIRFLYLNHLSKFHFYLTPFQINNSSDIRSNKNTNDLKNICKTTINQKIFKISSLLNKTIHLTSIYHLNLFYLIFLENYYTIIPSSSLLNTNPNYIEKTKAITITPNKNISIINESAYNNNSDVNKYNINISKNANISKDMKSIQTPKNNISLKIILNSYHNINNYYFSIHNLSLSFAEADKIINYVNKTSSFIETNPDINDKLSYNKCFNDVFKIKFFDFYLHDIMINFEVNKQLYYYLKQKLSLILKIVSIKLKKSLLTINSFEMMKQVYFRNKENDTDKEDFVYNNEYFKLEFSGEMIKGFSFNYLKLHPSVKLFLSVSNYSFLFMINSQN